MQDILINWSPQETRVAVVEHGAVQELHVERTLERGLVGNVYLGKVSRVLPGMQSAFIDIGLERTAFLHVADIVAPFTPGSRPMSAVARARRRSATAVSVPIEKQVFEGQSLLVQVIKDPIGTKGARLSTQISIAGRLLVFLPQDNHIGVSQKIAPDLRDALRARDAGADRRRRGGRGQRRARVRRLHPAHQRRGLERRRTGGRHRLPAQGLVAHPRGCAEAAAHVAAAPGPEPAAARAARPDQRRNHQHPHRLARAVRGAAQVRPASSCPRRPEGCSTTAASGRSSTCTTSTRTSRGRSGRRVDLKSGGYLIIDQTEALTTVDVNTGGYVGARNFDDTIFKTNLEAAQAIARQLRLRNLGGIVIVDFIDMARDDHREQVLAEFRKQLARDRVKTSAGGFSQLGLVEMTRKRTRESLAHMLCEPCVACSGQGIVKTARTVAYDALREILREARQFTPREFRIVSSPEVIELFLDEESQHLAGLTDFIGKPISLQAETSMGQGQYDIVLL